MRALNTRKTLTLLSSALLCGSLHAYVPVSLTAAANTWAMINYGSYGKQVHADTHTITHDIAKKSEALLAQFPVAGPGGDLIDASGGGLPPPPRRPKPTYLGLRVDYARVDVSRCRSREEVALKYLREYMIVLERNVRDIDEANVVSPIIKATAIAEIKVRVHGPGHHVAINAVDRLFLQLLKLEPLADQLLEIDDQLDFMMQLGVPLTDLTALYGRTSEDVHDAYRDENIHLESEREKRDQMLEQGIELDPEIDSPTPLKQGETSADSGRLILPTPPKPAPEPEQKEGSEQDNTPETDEE